ncbi:MAG: LamG domain-containing protein, partial [Patescibacteria group bacterium]
SISVWVNRTTGGGGVVLHKDHQYTLKINPTGSITWADNSCWNYGIFGDHGNVPENQWTNILATKNGTIVSIYINGESVISKPFACDNPYILNIPAFIGEYVSCSPYSTCPTPYIFYNATNPPDTTFNGAIDELMIFNRSLSSAEINQIYEAQK